MKNKSKSRISRVFKRVINIRTWLDWDRLKSNTLSLGTIIKRMFVLQDVGQTESFKEAVEKLSLSEEALASKQIALFRLSMLMVVLAVLILGYCGYEFYNDNIKAAVVSLVVAAIALALAFRYHFWYFQIKKRKLGCSLHEWFRQGLLGEKE